MERVIQKRLAKDLPLALKERLLAELEIIRRLPGQYPYSWEEALEMMKKHIRDFSREEFQELWEDDAMDWIYLQGKVYFKENFFSNLMKTRDWLCRRLLFPEMGEGKWEKSQFLDKTIARMKEKGGISCRFRMKTVLQLEEQAQRTGEAIRVYLPIPVEYAQVKSFRLLHAQVWFGGGQIREVPVFRAALEKWDASSENSKEWDDSPENSKEWDNSSENSKKWNASPENKGDNSFVAWIAPEHAPQRTICFQGKYEKDAHFEIEYEYQIDMPYIDLKHKQKPLVRGWIPRAEEDKPEHYLGEQLPHVHFTPYLKALAKEIVGDEGQPLEKARRIYDYITTHLMYSFVRDYFSITELVDYTASGWKGDCGLQALLFITLCRISGVPARWQSGLYAKPGDVGSHDWAMFYVEEYGWLFADCSFGGSAARMGCEERREFYFGNLDPYRMPACCQFQADFLPPVKGLRIDPYDNQTGEAEYADRCLRAGEIETKHEVCVMETH